MRRFPSRLPFLLTFVSAIIACGSQTTRAQEARLDLDSVNTTIKWQVKSQSDIGGDFSPILSPNYDTSKWVAAHVPGTVFTSYVAAGLEKDPNFGDNIQRVDKTKYDRDFWYRTQFSVPARIGIGAAQNVWLNFEGVNRKGDVYFNGTSLGRLDGFMQRGHFDITSLLRKEGNNVLAVLIHWAGSPPFQPCQSDLYFPAPVGTGCPTFPASFRASPTTYISPLPVPSPSLTPGCEPTCPPFPKPMSPCKSV